MTKKVIIIDDSITQLNILRALFEKDGWEAHTALNAKEAFEVIFDCAPDLIITDAIMPVMGGFQLIKAIRENEHISKIPIIVYSVLNENNAKFYIKENLSEYFLKKEDNLDELLKLAKKIVKNYPLRDDYKLKILKVPRSFNCKQEPEEEVIEKSIPSFVINKEELENSFRKNIDFSKNDDEIFQDIFSILFQNLNYDLALISVFSVEKGEKYVYFDIKDIILSPIFQENILNKFNCTKSILFKKYAPNLKIITNEDEFNSKIDFSFDYSDKEIAKIVFYSRSEDKWRECEDIDFLKEILEKFFKNYALNKSNRQNKKEPIKYSSNDTDNFNIFKNNDFIYYSIIQITNFQDLINNLSKQEVDIIISKVSERIMSYLDKDESIYKNEENEYTVIITAQEEESAKAKLDFISNLINTISYNNHRVKADIAACKYVNDKNFNINQAYKNVHKILEDNEEGQLVVIK